MFKVSSTKYYQDNKIQKKPLKNMKFYIKKKKEKSNNSVVNDTNIYPKMKNKN